MKTIIFIILYTLSVLAVLMFVYLGKYIPLEIALQKISQREYNITDYNCLDFSNDLVKELESKGIQSSIVIGESPLTIDDDKVRHVWVGVWFEPQWGNYTKDYVVEKFIN